MIVVCSHGVRDPQADLRAGPSCSVRRGEVRVSREGKGMRKDLADLSERLKLFVT